MKSLDLSKKNIEDLDFDNNDIEELDLSESTITNVQLEKISHLKNLRILNLSDTSIEDLSFLENLTYLEEVDISGTKVIDLSSLCNLSYLRSLKAHDTSINDLSPLRGLSNLKEIHMERADIEDVTPLGEVSSLEVIDFYGNSSLQDISAFSNLKNLRKLILKNTSIEPNSLNSLEELEKLQELIVDEELNFAAKAILCFIEGKRGKIQNQNAAKFFNQSVPTPPINLTDSIKDENSINQLKAKATDQKFIQGLTTLLEQHNMISSNKDDSELINHIAEQISQILCKQACQTYNQGQKKVGVALNRSLQQGEDARRVSQVK